MPRVPSAPRHIYATHRPGGRVLTVLLLAALLYYFWVSGII